jgi:protein-L-isoaspartate O-methyltransferase
MVPGPGRLLCPVGVGHAQQLVVIDRDLDGNLQEQSIDGVEFPPLTSVACQLDIEAFD